MSFEPCDEFEGSFGWIEPGFMQRTSHALEVNGRVFVVDPVDAPAGNVTYPKAEELREAARRVPADRLLVETDSPYLSPQPRRGRPNEPANVVHTAGALAEARGEDPAELAARLDANAAAAFSLP